MASFDEAFGFVVGNEGGYVNNPNDPGGETKWGISKRAYPNLDIKNLTIEQAKEIYKRDYWKRDWDSISSQAVANKIFDISVNLGTHALQSILQRSFRRAIVTAEDINSQDPQKTLDELRAQQAYHYAEMALKNPRLDAFLLGWMRRAVK